MNVSLTILCFFIVAWLAFGCFYLSKDYESSAREMEELCRSTQKISFGLSGGQTFSTLLRDTSCYDDDLQPKIQNLYSKSGFFSIAGTGLLLTFCFLPILFWFRTEQNNKNAVESLMNSDAVKPD